MMRAITRSLTLLFIIFISAAAYGSTWELRRDDLHSFRPPIVQGVVTINLEEESPGFPRYLNEMGVKKIRIRFRDPGTGMRKISLVWTGGSQGPDKFAVKVANAFWMREHEKWNDTHKAYLAAGRKNPDPKRYPWNVLYTRILNCLFLKLQNEYGPEMWEDFFSIIRQMDYPLHRAKKTERMKAYADIFSVLFGRDMQKEFRDFGIDLDADPPWGWETYKKNNNQ